MGGEGPSSATVSLRRTPTKPRRAGTSGGEYAREAVHPIPEPFDVFSRGGVIVVCYCAVESRSAIRADAARG